MWRPTVSECGGPPTKDQRLTEDTIGPRSLNVPPGMPRGTGSLPFSMKTSSRCQDREYRYE